MPGGGGARLLLVLILVVLVAALLLVLLAALLLGLVLGLGLLSLLDLGGGERGKAGSGGAEKMFVEGR